MTKMEIASYLALQMTTNRSVMETLARDGETTEYIAKCQQALAEAQLIMYELARKEYSGE